MLLLTAAALLSMLDGINGKLEISANNNVISASLAKLLIDSKSRRVLFVSDENNNIPKSFLQGVPRVLTNETILLEKNKIFLMNEKAQTYVIAPKNIETLKGTLDALTASDIFQPGQFLIITNQSEALQEIANVLWGTFRLPNSLIITLPSLDVYWIKILNCSNSTTIQLMCTIPNCSVDSLIKFDFKKTFQGCPIKVLWMRYPPFVYTRDEPSGWKGIFVDFLDSLSHLSQRPLTLVNEDDLEYVEELSKMYNYEIIVEDLEEADIFIGPSDLATGSLFHLSTILNSDHLSFFCPKTPLNYWKHLTGVMNIIYKWLLVTIALVGVVMLFLGDFSRQGLRDALLNITLFLYGTLLGNGWRASWLKHTRLQLYLCHLLVLFMVISFFVQGSLVSVLSGPAFEPAITTTQELIETNLPFKTSPMIKTLFVFYASFVNDPGLKQLEKKLDKIDENLLLNILDELIKTKNFSTIMLEAWIFMRPNVEKRFDYFPFLTIHNCLAMGKNSYQSRYFHKWITEGLAAGFLERYKKTHQFELGLKWNVEMEEKVFVVTIVKISPAMKWVILGDIISFGIFVMEIVWFYGRRYWRGHSNSTRRWF
ncbi:uncharacterized protein [Euwallacea fornicatus]|uniref:uncharacterized protein n=1 Tax=Euwallacea fornicatus TaxID=995702 RepID=UPI00338DEF8D